MWIDVVIAFIKRITLQIISYIDDIVEITTQTENMESRHLRYGDERPLLATYSQEYVAVEPFVDGEDVVSFEKAYLLDDGHVFVLYDEDFYSIYDIGDKTFSEVQAFTPHTVTSGSNTADIPRQSVASMMLKDDVFYVFSNMRTIQHPYQFYLRSYDLEFNLIEAVILSTDYRNLFIPNSSFYDDHLYLLKNESIYRFDRYYRRGYSRRKYNLDGEFVEETGDSYFADGTILPVGFWGCVPYNGRFIHGYFGDSIAFMDANLQSIIARDVSKFIFTGDSLMHIGNVPERGFNISKIGLTV